MRVSWLLLVFFITPFPVVQAETAVEEMDLFEFIAMYEPGDEDIIDAELEQQQSVSKVSNKREQNIKTSDHHEEK